MTDHPTPAEYGGSILISIVGQNENGILRHLSQTLMDLLQPYGFEGHVIDVNQPDWITQLAALLPRGIAMAWGHAGVGAALQANDTNLWEQLQIPFVSVLADPPCWLPRNHAVASRFVINAYLFREWFDVQKRMIRSRQLSALIPPGVVPNPFRDTTPWRDRDVRAAFVKTGENPDIRRQSWLGFPRRTRAAIEDAAAAALARGTGDITQIVLDAFAANGLAWEGRSELLFASMYEVDIYVRATRSSALARALRPLSVDIFGRGWDHLAVEPGRARFHPPFDAAGLPALYGRTQFLLNTTPNFGAGLHERVLQGLDSRCCVVSDENDASRAQLTAIPTFFGIDPFASDSTDRLAALFEGQTDYTAQTDTGVAFVESEYSGEAFMRALLDLAQEVRAAHRLEAFRCAA